MNDERSRFSAHDAPLNNGNARLYRIRADGRPLRHALLPKLLGNDSEFRAFFNRTIATAPFDALRFELPPLSHASHNDNLEFVLIDDPRLDVIADPSAFQEHFDAAKNAETVVGFANLGRDGYLITPTDLGEPQAYAHLAAFARHAPEQQRDDLWRRVGKALALRITDKGIWLNTAGDGVPWLHVRFDTRPKYYAYAPYKRPPIHE